VVSTEGRIALGVILLAPQSVHQPKLQSSGPGFCLCSKHVLQLFFCCRC
jgi:hypothetical protein